MGRQGSNNYERVTIEDLWLIFAAVTMSALQPQEILLLFKL
jgi:hypothetical protein